MYDEPEECLNGLLNEVISKIHSDEQRDEVSQSLLLLLVRVANSRRSIFALCHAFPGEQGHQLDVAGILRFMFDAYLQAAYITLLPAEMKDRANLYLDFEHVERSQLSERVLKHDNHLSRSLKQSQMKPEGEKHVKKEYDRVAPSYFVKEKKKDGTVKLGPKVRSHWYEGNLAQLAKAASRENEYDTFITPYNDCVHSGAYSVMNGPMADDNGMKILSSILVARVLKMNVDYNKHELGKNQNEFIDIVAKGILEYEEHPV